MRPRTLTHDVTGEGDPLVLVPGGLTGWLSWAPVVPRLSDHHRVIRVQPIHNELGADGVRGDPGHTLEVERDSLGMTLDALDLGPTDLVGWSRGAWELLELALARHPGIRSLALIEPPARWVLDLLGESDPDEQAAGPADGRLGGREVTEDDLARFLVYAGLSPDEASARSHPNWDLWVDVRATLSWPLPPVPETRTLADLDAVDRPVLLIKGSRTKAWQARVVDVLADRLPDAVMIELDGTHAAHLENLDRFCSALEAHLHG